MTETLSEPLVQTIQINMPCQLGFHLRVVGRFVTHVKQFNSTIRVRKGKVTANGKSIMGLLLLAVTWKSKLEIEAIGDDAMQAINGIKEFFDRENVSSSFSSKGPLLTNPLNEGCGT
jgi:phosphocarrier protein